LICERTSDTGREDRLLGLAEPITRRDFFNSTLLAVGASLLGAATPADLLASASEWDGYGGVGDYARSHGNTQEVMQVAHEIRDGRYNQPPARATKTGEFFDLVVVGAGLSGLSAAYYFRKRCVSDQRCLILDNHPIFGGESKRNEFLVGGQQLIGPQGANEFDIPQPGEDGSELYDELGIPREFEYAPWDEQFKKLQFDRTNYGFQLWVDEASSFGTYFEKEITGGRPRWVSDLWGNQLRDAPWPEPLKKHFLAWRYGDRQMYGGENFERWLDTMTYREYLEEVMKLQPEVTRYVDPVLAAAIGLGSDVISAFAARSVGMPGFQGFAQVMAYPQKWESTSPLTWHSFPGGNDGFARYFVKALIPEAIAGSRSFGDVLNGRVDFRALDRPDQRTQLRLGATVVRVEHDGLPENAKSVTVTYVSAGKIYRLKARRVVMAGGGWVTRHAVRDLPDNYRQAYAQFFHSPMLVVNLALKHWRFLYQLGLTAFRWFQGFGFCCNLRHPMWVGNHRPPLNPKQPALLTFYVPFYYPGRSIQKQGSMGRAELLSTPFKGYERQIRQQLVKLFGEAGFDPRRDVAGIVLNRWGHAYVNPQPGFYFHPKGEPVARDLVRRPFGRIAFGHSELVGHQYWLGAIGEGRRAVEQISPLE
jgi:spermidine dehydrogenase